MNQGPYEAFRRVSFVQSVNPTPSSRLVTYNVLALGMANQQREAANFSFTIYRSHSLMYATGQSHGVII